jgi:hypothetical protein
MDKHYPGDLGSAPSLRNVLVKSKVKGPSHGISNHVIYYDILGMWDVVPSQSTTRNEIILLFIQSPTYTFYVHYMSEQARGAISRLSKMRPLSLLILNIPHLHLPNAHV